MNFANKLDDVLVEKVIHPVKSAKPEVGVGETIRMLEADLADEVKAIAQYDVHIKAIHDKKVKEQLTEIRDEEKHHADELRLMIAELQELQKEEAVEVEVSEKELEKIKAFANKIKGK